MDLARSVLREDQEPARATADDGGRRRPDERRRQRPRGHRILHRGDSARSSPRADPLVLARQPPVRRVDSDRLHRDAALSRDEGRGRAWQGLLDGGGAGKDGGLRARHPFAAPLPGADGYGRAMARGQGHARLRCRRAIDPEASARLRREGRLGLALSASRHDERRRRDRDTAQKRRARRGDRADDGRQRRRAVRSGGGFADAALARGRCAPSLARRDRSRGGRGPWRTTRSCSTRSTATIWTPSWNTSPRTPSSTCREARTPGGSGSSFALRCTRVSPVDSRAFPTFTYGNARDFVSGNMAFFEWTVTGTRPIGERVEAHGTDHWEFRDGKVVRKDSYWKMIEK